MKTNQKNHTKVALYKTPQTHFDFWSKILSDLKYKISQIAVLCDLNWLFANSIGPVDQWTLDLQKSLKVQYHHLLVDFSS